MGVNIEYRERLEGEVSEIEMGSYFEKMLRDSGERIEFRFGERPVGNLLKGKGVVMAIESINEWTSLVVETDRLKKDPFSIDGDFLIWRCVHADGGNEVPRTDLPKLYDPYIKVSRKDKGYFFKVRRRLPYNSKETIGYFPEAKELLEAWAEGRKLPVGW